MTTSNAGTGQDYGKKTWFKRVRSVSFFVVFFIFAVFVFLFVLFCCCLFCFVFFLSFFLFFSFSLSLSCLFVCCCCLNFCFSFSVVTYLLQINYSLLLFVIIIIILYIDNLGFNAMTVISARIIFFYIATLHARYFLAYLEFYLSLRLVAKTFATAKATGSFITKNWVCSCRLPFVSAASTVKLPLQTAYLWQICVFIYICELCGDILQQQLGQ